MWEGKTQQIFQFSVAQMLTEKRCICKKRWKDNLNQVIFHCILSGIIFFILASYPLMEYYLPFPLSYSYSHISFFYLCLHIYRSSYVTMLMVPPLIRFEKATKQTKKEKLKTYLLLLLTYKFKCVLLIHNIIVSHYDQKKKVLECWSTFQAFGVWCLTCGKLLIYFMFIDFLSTFFQQTSSEILTLFRFAWPHLDLEKKSQLQNKHFSITEDNFQLFCLVASQNN